MRPKTIVILSVLFLCLSMPQVSEARVSVSNGLTHEKSAKAGGTYNGVIIIENRDNEPQEVKIYQTDYFYFLDGRNIYGEPGKDPRSNAKWITFKPSRFVVQPKGKSEVNYTVKVPDNKALVGTYWSMIMVEGIGKESPEATDAKVKKDEIKVSLRTVMRYAIQMVTHIGNTGTRSLKFLAIKLLKEDGGKRILQVDIENTGERWLKPLFWVEIYEEKGKHVGKFMGKKRRPYPGMSIRATIDLGKLPKGKYKSLIVADCGGEDLFGATCNLEIGR